MLFYFLEKKYPNIAVLKDISTQWLMIFHRGCKEYLRMEVSKCCPGIHFAATEENHKNVIT